MRAAILILTLLLVLGGCATQGPPLPKPDDLLHDELFGKPTVRVDPAAPLALSASMREYLASKRLPSSWRADRRRRLVDALYKGDLKLEYDAEVTRTAAEAFDARSGNCLALVLMTSAFAKELGLSVTYQNITGDEAWNRSSELYIALGHVNLLLEDKAGLVDSRNSSSSSMTIDFLPPHGRTVAWPIEENTVVAMYFNNRAVESMTEGRTADAYAYAREAVRQDPQMLAGYVTLAVLYRAAHRPDWAEATLQRVLAKDPDNLNALSNRLLLLRDQSRTVEADALAARLAQLDPAPPFSYFNAGRDALRAGRLEDARRLFQKEVQRAPYYHEFEFWLAITYMQMNDSAQAASHLRKAMDVSTTRHDHDLYAAKLDRLRSLQMH